jgi:hypothetical protein
MRHSGSLKLRTGLRNRHRGRKGKYPRKNSPMQNYSEWWLDKDRHVIIPADFRDGAWIRKPSRGPGFK